VLCKKPQMEEKKKEAGLKRPANVSYSNSPFSTRKKKKRGSEKKDLVRPTVRRGAESVCIHPSEKKGGGGEFRTAQGRLL